MPGNSASSGKQLSIGSSSNLWVCFAWNNGSTCITNLQDDIIERLIIFDIFRTNEHIKNYWKRISTRELCNFSGKIKCRDGKEPKTVVSSSG